MMSRPAALSSRAFIDTAMVADGWMRFRLSAMKPMGSIFLDGAGGASRMADRNGGDAPF